MCLMIWKPAHVVLTKREVHDYYDHNPDGFGILWQNPDTKRIAWYKMVGGKKATWRAYQKYAAGRDCALHWRMATAGAINLEMAHPFKIGDSVHMMHNGVLDCITTPERSDTAEFADIMERELANHPARLDDASYIAELDSVIGYGNRLLFMRDGFAEPVIVGRGKGVDHNGAWYSNIYAWTNTYYDPLAWRPGLGWSNWEDELPTTPIIRLDDPAPRTEREKNAVQQFEVWLGMYRYADIEETIDYFVDWYGYTDSDRVRLRIVLENAAYDCVAPHAA